MERVAFSCRGRFQRQYRFRSTIQVAHGALAGSSRRPIRPTTGRGQHLLAGPPALGKSPQLGANRRQSWYSPAAMKVTCQACSAQYTIADDKVKGRKVKIRCKACQTPIVVDGQNPPPEAASSGLSDAPPALDPFAPETALAPDADVWNVNLSDTDSRTMTTA